MTYPGGKGASFRNLINQIPVHAHTIELFAGSAALLCNLRPAAAATAIDVDGHTIAELRACPDLPVHTTITHSDALPWLDRYGHTLDAHTFLYADPPYLYDVRSSHRQIYRCEFATVAEHLELLRRLQTLNCMVMVSGYWSALYDMQIGDWRTVRFTAQTRGGKREECLWMNYPPPAVLHDCSYLGDDYRERERIKRKKQRWLDRLRSMQTLERQAMLSAIAETWPELTAHLLDLTSS